jgi:hypothetical protein
MHAGAAHIVSRFCPPPNPPITPIGLPEVPKTAYLSQKLDRQPADYEQDVADHTESGTAKGKSR